MKKVYAVSLTPEVKEASVRIIGKQGISFSGYIEQKLRELIKKNKVDISYD